MRDYGECKECGGTPPNHEDGCSFEDCDKCGAQHGECDKDCPNAYYSSEVSDV